MKTNINIKGVLVLSILSAISFFIQGCTKTGDILNTGTIVGFIRPVDESGTIVTDKSGVTVTIEGTDFTGLTDANGRYEINGIPVGSYVLNYTNEAYGNYRINRVTVAGGEIPSFVQPSELYQKPTLTISNIIYSYYYLQGWFTINISGSITPTVNYGLLVCAGTDADVSDTHFDKIMTSYYSTDIETNQFSVSMLLDANTYSSGQKIYTVLYLLNVKDKVSYYNSLTGCYMYQSAVKASDVYMITL